MPQRIPECVLTPLEVRTPLAGAVAGAGAGAKLLWKPYTASQEKHVFI